MVIESFDVVIIGAGLYGICGARNYLEIHPNASVLIIEGSSHVGGVWSSERVYDGFWTQTVLGMAEFSDCPLLPPPSEEQYYGFFPARHITAYLERYVDSHVYGGQTLRDRIRFNCCVSRVEKSGEKWNVYYGEKGMVVTAMRLMVATGLTSTPKMPVLHNQNAFNAPIMHQKDFGQSSILASSGVTHVTVLGGGKSAADIAYAAAKAGKKVTWIIRKRGAGPAAQAPAKGAAVYKNVNELLYNRLSSSFSPSVFLQESWLTKFLHWTWLGRGLTARIWARIDKEYRKVAGYGRQDGMKMGFGQLEPDTPLFWQNDSTGVNQKPDFWDTIATQVRIYREDIANLDDHCIHLENGDPIPSDVLVCATGWRPSLSFFNSAQASELGLSTPQVYINPMTATKWQKLDQDAEIEILQQFPSLANPPPHPQPETSNSPFRLYKMIASPHDPTILFLGHISVANSFRAAECQALWAVAYFDGNIRLPSKTQTDKEIARTVAWCRRRYPYQGVRGVWLYYDLVPYTDDLLAQIGLTSHQSSGLKDWWAPCVAADLKGLLGEYRSRFAGKEVAG